MGFVNLKALEEKKKSNVIYSCHGSMKPIWCFRSTTSVCQTLLLCIQCGDIKTSLAEIMLQPIGIQLDYIMFKGEMFV